MAFVKSAQVKKWGSSKVIWLPNEWGVKKGDLMEIKVTLDGKTYIHTTKAKENSSRFLCIPKWWACEVGDVIDASINYATVPIRPTDD